MNSFWKKVNHCIENLSQNLFNIEKIPQGYHETSLYVDMSGSKTQTQKRKVQDTGKRGGLEQPTAAAGISNQSLLKVSLITNVLRRNFLVTVDLYVCLYLGVKHSRSGSSRNLEEDPEGSFSSQSRYRTCMRTCVPILLDCLKTLRVIVRALRFQGNREQ